MSVVPDPAVLQRAAAVRLLVFDVDGVLTDGRLYIDNRGEEFKAFHARDGHGMRMLLDAGVAIAIITGRQSGIVEHRARELGIEHVYQGRREKLGAYRSLRERTALADEAIAYVGDDVVDLPVMTRVGLAVAVQDAHPLVRRHAHWCTEARGGRGAGREVCELLMLAQGTLETALAGYLR